MADRVLVTGGTGFLAAHCIVRLLRSGYHVRTTLRSLSRTGEVREMLERGGASAQDVEFAEADLMSDRGWPDAASECAFVLHVASPLPVRQPKNPDELIMPAREGALRVLRAASQAGVRRVVLTSSFAAIGYGHGVNKNRFDENDWSDPGAGVSPYVQSKTYAELAAWDFVRRSGNGLELTTVNPVVIFGPALGGDISASLAAVQYMLQGKLPLLPRSMFGAVDVRNCADLHLLAMTHPAAAGERFLCSAGDFISLREAAKALKGGLGPDAARVSCREAPDWLVRFAARFNATARQAAGPDLGKYRNASSEKARRLLGWKTGTPQEAIVAAGRSLIELDLIAR